MDFFRTLRARPSFTAHPLGTLHLNGEGVVPPHRRVRSDPPKPMARPLPTSGPGRAGRASPPMDPQPVPPGAGLPGPGGLSTRLELFRSVDHPGRSMAGPPPGTCFHGVTDWSLNLCQSQTHTVRHDTSKHRTKVVGNIGLIFHAQKDGVPFTQRFCCIFLHWFDEIFPYKVYVVPAFASFLHFIFLSFLSPPQKNSPLVPFSVFVGSVSLLCTH